MSPEAQRIAITEACGWTKVRPHLGGIIGVPPEGGRYETLHVHTKFAWAPDHLTDLTAMHAGIAAQDDMFQVAFAGALSARAGMLGKWTHQLTAKDWADCFTVVLQSKREGGVIGKWVETAQEAEKA